MLELTLINRDTSHWIIKITLCQYYRINRYSQTINVFKWVASGSLTTNSMYYWPTVGEGLGEPLRLVMLPSKFKITLHKTYLAVKYTAHFGHYDLVSVKSCSSTDEMVPCWLIAVLVRPLTTFCLTFLFPAWAIIWDPRRPDVVMRMSRPQMSNFCLPSEI